MNATMNSQTMTASCIYFEKAFVGFLDDDDDDDDLAQKNVCGLCSSKYEILILTKSIFPFLAPRRRGVFSKLRWWCVCLNVQYSPLSN